MKNLKIYFVESEFQDLEILGRKAKDYIFKEFDGVEYEVVKDFCDIDLSVYPVAVLPLDAPLITQEYLFRMTEFAKRKGVGKLCFGNEKSPYFLKAGKGKTTYFVEDQVFLQLGGAKNYNMVYNTIRKGIILRLVQDGILLLGEEFHIDDTVIVESGVTIKSPTTLKGNTVIRQGVVVENSIIIDSEIEEGASVTCSHLYHSKVGKNTTVGPFARLRDADIRDNCRIGDFVEVKNSQLNTGVKCAHLSYVGDAKVGENTNIGCGSVFCNYDGKLKHHTEVGKNVFIGANVNLVAPLSIGDNTYIAAGTTVTKDVTDNGFVIGRVRQEIKDTKPKSRN